MPLIGSNDTRTCQYSDFRELNQLPSQPSIFWFPIFASFFSPPHHANAHKALHRQIQTHQLAQIQLSLVFQENLKTTILV